MISGCGGGGGTGIFGGCGSGIAGACVISGCDGGGGTGIFGGCGGCLKFNGLFVNTGCVAGGRGALIKGGFGNFESFLLIAFVGFGGL